MPSDNSASLSGSTGEGVTHFRWDTVPTSDRDWLRRRTDDIVGISYRTACDAVRIGQWLNDAKTRLDPGTFIAWIESQLPFSVATAHRYRQVATAFVSFSTSHFEMFDESALYALAQFQTPQAAREHAVQLAEEGERIDRALALSIIDAHKPLSDEEVEADHKRQKRIANKERKENAHTRKCLGLDCEVEFLSHGEHFCPSCRAKKESIAPNVQVLEPQQALKYWQRLVDLVNRASVVRIERIDECDEEDDTLYSVTVHLGDDGPRNAVRRELFDALGEVSDAPPEMRFCSAPGCGMRPVGMFGKNRLNPGGLMYRCKTCEKARRAEMRRIAREQRAMRLLGQQSPPDDTQAA